MPTLKRKYGKTTDKYLMVGKLHFWEQRPLPWGFCQKNSPTKQWEKPTNEKYVWK